MAFHESSPTVLLLPEASPLRAEVEAAVARVGLTLAPSLQTASLVVLDAGAPGWTDAAVAVDAERYFHELTCLALVPDGAFEVPVQLPLADALARGRTAAELPWRLVRAAERHREKGETLRRQRDLSLLLELTADYAETQDVEALLHDVTRRLADEMEIARASLVVLERDGETGRILAASDAKRDEAVLRDRRIDLARYPEVREVVRTGRPVLIDDAAAHPLLEGVQAHPGALGIHAIAALPLPSRGEVLGVLLLRAAGRRRGFSPREVDFLTTVAHATAVALRNASLVRQVRGETQREKTARIAAETKAASLERYHRYFACVTEGVAILDGRARVLSLNPAGAALLGVRPEEARGAGVEQLFRPADAPGLAALVAATAGGEARTAVDLDVRDAAGRALVVSLSSAPLEAEDGEAGPDATILSFRDVTQARRLEGELRQTKEFLERIIDSSVDAIIASDMRGRIILYNRGAEAICGWTAQEALTGQVRVRQLYPPKGAEEVMTALRSAEHGGPGRLSVSRREVLNKSGERVPVNMTAAILYEDGKEVATMGIFTDLRDRMQLEAKLSDAETRLEASEKNAVIVALAGTAAHELNQPLTSVMGYAELLKRKLKEDDSAWRPVDIIYREAERMAEIVRKIGRITRYETKAYVGAQQILDLDKASSHEE